MLFLAIKMFLKFLSGKERVLPEFPVDKSNVWGKIELYRKKEEGEDLIIRVQK